MADVEKQAVAVATPTVPMHDQEKQGSKCCGCCCDFRRAVIIVNAINVVLGVLGIIGVAALAGLAAASDFSDDSVQSDFDAEVKRGTTTAGITSGISLVISILAIFGAVKFNIYMVAPSIVWLVISFILNIILTISNNNRLEEDFSDYEAPNQIPGFVISAIITGLFIYPHAGFIQEVRSGIMSQETYPREEFSCCCTPKRR